MDGGVTAAYWYGELALRPELAVGRVPPVPVARWCGQNRAPLDDHACHGATCASPSRGRPTDTLSGLDPPLSIHEFADYLVVPIPTIYD